jgi:hypothetical protein
MIRAVALAALLFVAAGCRGPCDRLVARYCDCDLSSPENQRGCEMARDEARRRAAAEKARRRGRDLDPVCREKLESFECPDRAVPEFYPGGFSFYE